MANVVKIDKIREELSTSYFVTQSPKLELDEELHDKEQKIYTNFFCFYVLKELSSKSFS